jgi:hypothetical protein
MYKQYLEYAAQMVGNGDSELLNYKLVNYLDQLNDMVSYAGGLLISRQAIAVAIQNWLIHNPYEKAYGD